MARIKKITQQEVVVAAQALAAQIPFKEAYRVFGIPRGGVPAALALASVSHGRIRIVDDPEEADMFIDDIIDSGRTRATWSAKHLTPFGALFGKRPVAPGAKVGIEVEQDEWLVFPWEGSNAEASAADIPTRLLQLIGENPEREGLRETPARFIKSWLEITEGYRIDPSSVLKVFEDGAEKCDEMVVQRDIPLYSNCEHHMVPFFGVAHIAYIPSGKVVGLSKLARLTNVFARRLQVQERLTNQIADALNEHLQPQGVAVVLQCRHLCMEMRGVQRIGTSTMTSALRGLLKEGEARSEFFSLIGSTR